MEEEPRIGFELLVKRGSNIFVKKPLPSSRPSPDKLNELTPLSTPRTSSYESWDPSSSESTASNLCLERHLSLMDLLAIGIGCTIGSGLFVLSGLVAHEYAGPASAISWAIAGFASCLSGACYAELSSRIPLAGSAYAYSFVAMGEFPAVLAAACLALDYVGSSAAVSRSFGDKVVAWLADHYGAEHWAVTMGGSAWSPFAFIISFVTALLLLAGIKASKSVTKFFTATKVLLVAFMISVGTAYIQPMNWRPFVPSQFGYSGVLRGATATFFGYLGYDEIAVLGAEALEPKKNLPRAILSTIISVSLIYVVAAMILTGMSPFEEISAISGFPSAFESNGAIFAGQVTAIGEIFTLPVVILTTIMGQPRLQYALSRDGLLPPSFGEIDSNGNLTKGSMICGGLMVAIATFVPFDHLNDMISCGVLTALSLTDTSLILLWHPSPPSRTGLAESMMGLFHILALFTGLALSHFLESIAGVVTVAVGITSMLVCVAFFVNVCPRSNVFGSGNNTTHPTSMSDGYFQTPLVPIVPCLGIFLNWFLISQLQFSGILIYLGYLVMATLYYFFYAIHHSVSNNSHLF